MLSVGCIPVVLDGAHVEPIMGGIFGFLPKWRKIFTRRDALWDKVQGTVLDPMGNK